MKIKVWRVKYDVERLKIENQNFARKIQNRKIEDQNFDSHDMQWNRRYWRKKRKKKIVTKSKWWNWRKWKRRKKRESNNWLNKLFKIDCIKREKNTIDCNDINHKKLKSCLVMKNYSSRRHRTHDRTIIIERMWNLRRDEDFKNALNRVKNTFLKFNTSYYNSSSWWWEKHRVKINENDEERWKIRKKKTRSWTTMRNLFRHIFNLNITISRSWNIWTWWKHQFESIIYSFV